VGQLAGRGSDAGPRLEARRGLDNAEGVNWQGDDREQHVEERSHADFIGY
jgi:hypothetical protein